MSLSLTVSFVNVEATSVTAAVIDILTTTLNSNFDAQLFTIQVKIIKCYGKLSDCIVKRHRE